MLDGGCIGWEAAGGDAVCGDGDGVAWSEIGRSGAGERSWRNGVCGGCERVEQQARGTDAEAEGWEDCREGGEWGAERKRQRREGAGVSQSAADRVEPVDAADANFRGDGGARARARCVQSVPEVHSRQGEWIFPPQFNQGIVRSLILMVDMAHGLHRCSLC